MWIEETLETVLRAMSSQSMVRKNSLGSAVLPSTVSFPLVQV